MVCTGPDARKVISKVTDVDLSDEAFPFFTSQEFYVKNVPVTALRVSYAGELGWEFYTPAEYGERLWEHLLEAGKEYDIRPYGNGALDVLRCGGWTSTPSTTRTRRTSAGRSTSTPTSSARRPSPPRPPVTTSATGRPA
jgi:glycine cleavage system aminomethyltransferase T